jgi:L-asparaginase II
MNWEALYPESHLKRTARQFAASIQAHALLELGFEEHINDYSARDLGLIATQITGETTNVLRQAAKSKAEGREAELLEELL